MKEEKIKKGKNYLTFKEMVAEYETRPKTKYLWSGIKEKSFGLVFGPSKSGKTIFCENLAMSIAIGAKEFFGYELDGIPKKVLFVGLEEFWLNRIERNKKQFNSLDENEKELLENNYRLQGITFSKRITSDENWNDLEIAIRGSEAEVVFIDSVTRMNPGKLEDSNTAEGIMQRLRDVCYGLGITLICIHHTPKIGDNAIIMDSIKGSAVFAQESDFAIGIHCTSKKNRYMKNVFFRYAPDDDEVVKEFEIGNDTWLNHLADVDEMEILERTDRRRNTGNKDFMLSYFDQNPSMTYSTMELVDYFKSELPIQDRQIKSYLKDLVTDGKVVNPERGQYSSLRVSENSGNGEI